MPTDAGRLAEGCSGVRQRARRQTGTGEPVRTSGLTVRSLELDQLSSGERDALEPLQSKAWVGDEVFHFVTSPTCVQVNDAGTEATFGYTIPAGAPTGLAGQPVAVMVKDGGSPGAVYDTYKHNFAAAQNSCLPLGGVYYEYPITAGNLTVFS